MKKTMISVCLAVAALLAGAWSRAEVVYSLPADFSGVQGQDGWHYGAVSHANYENTWAANWHDYYYESTYYQNDGPFWAGVFESGIWKRVYGNVLWSNHTDGPGVYWEAGAGSLYPEVTVLAQRTSGVTATFLNYWDASTATNTILTVGATNTLYNVAAGDKIAFIMNAGPGSTVIDGYAMTITIVPEPAALSLLALGGLVLARRRR